MSSKYEFSNSRRRFLKGAAVTAGAAATGTAISQAQAAALPDTWDLTVDVVVIGAGGAGLMAAIQASDAGAKVLVIDKGKSVFHTATRMCGGLFTACGTKLQKQNNVQDSPDAFANDVLAYGGYMNYPELLKVWTETSGEAFDWLSDRGLAEHRLEKYGGHSNLRAIRQVSYTGRDYVDVLWKEFQNRKLDIIHGAPVTRYFYDEKEQRIAGIEANESGKAFTVKANKGVILASGGFTGDSKVLDSWVPAVANAGIAIGCEANDGHAMMLAVRDLGIPLTHMQYIASYPWGVVTRGRNGVACRYLYFVQEGGILVNKKGKRFISEETGMTKVSTELPKQEEKAHFLLVDKEMWDETLKKYEIGSLFSMPAWSKARVDSELDKGQVLFKADNIEQLAQKAGIPPEALTATVSHYNQMVKDKDDADFKRKNLPREIKNGPCYMVRMSFWNNLVLGGVRINDKLQILNAEGKPIKGFYGAGEVVGGIHGTTYCGGNAISWCHTSGYIAGKSAAKDA